MELKTNIKKQRNLKDFTRLLIGFVFGLFGLAVYQQLTLYSHGIIDSPANKTLYLLLLNHLGFAAIISFIFLFLFRFLERKKPGMGFNSTLLAFSLILLFEALLVKYFLLNYSLFNPSDLVLGLTFSLGKGTLSGFVFAVILSLGCYYLFYKLAWFLNAFIGRMFPFTIVLFLFALSTSLTEKKPINQNKSQTFLVETVTGLIDDNKYEGNKEYPLLRDEQTKGELSKYFDLREDPPNIILIIIDGLSPDFIEGGKYEGFTPFLDSIKNKSLYWNRFLANSNNKTDALVNVVGSLPHAKHGFTYLEKTINRNTLFGLLKSNGYRTAFYYGGNPSLENLDKFLKEEQVDIILDKSHFGKNYTLQEEDRAGVTLGYPDRELYVKWGELYESSAEPKLEVFLNLSTSKPYAIPDPENHESLVIDILEEGEFDKKERRFIKKNKTLFSALNYTDAALEQFMRMHRLTKEHHNSIFIITGSGKSYLAEESLLKSQHVPFMIYSPLQKQSRQFDNLASHQDIAPDVLGLLKQPYSLKTPNQVTWLGNGLLHKENRPILLSSGTKGVKAVVLKNHYANRWNTYRVTADMDLNTPENNLQKELKQVLASSKAINSYVTANNKLLPDGLAIYKQGRTSFTKEQTVWINSVFNGRNYDNAFNVAKNLAHKGELDKSLLLCAYILEKVPGHIDAMVLKGRVYAWKKQYQKAMDILEDAVAQSPLYHDGYAALLDVYYWSGNNAKASPLYNKIKRNDLETVDLVFKVERCMKQIEKFEDLRDVNVTNLEFEDQ